MLLKKPASMTAQSWFFLFNACVKIYPEIALCESNVSVF